MTQGTSTISVYYSKLKKSWEDFEALVPAPCCNFEKSREFVSHLQKLKFQFLMGLNESYNQPRSQILLMSPLIKPMEWWLVTKDRSPYLLIQEF